MAHGRIWLWSHHIWLPTRQPVTPILSTAIPHIIPPLQAPGALQDVAQRSSLPRATPWWPSQATPVLSGGQGQSWGTQRGPSLLPRQQQLCVVPCSRVEQQGLGHHGHAGDPSIPIVSASHLLLLARGQQLGLVGHLLQPAGCAVSTWATLCLLPMLQVPASNA